MNPVSICIIAKNEEKNIRNFLNALQNHLPSNPDLYEILLTDTGSTDGTVEIAKEYHCRIEHFEWIQDFSAARNFAISQARFHQILFLDADEIPEEADWEEIFRLQQQYPAAVGCFLRRNLCRSGDGTVIMQDRVERFFDRRYYHYEGRIHEQLTSNDTSFLEAYDLPLTVYHEGYMGTEEVLAQKAKRNNELLFLELEKYPEDPYYYYQIGNSYSLMHEKEKQYEYYVKAYALKPDSSLAYFPDLMISLGQVMLQLEKYEEALQLLDEQYDSLREYADFLCFAGNLYIKCGMLVEAVSMYQEALAANRVMIEGSNSLLPNYNLGCIYEAFGDEEKALHCFDMAKDKPEALERFTQLSKRVTPERIYEKKVSVIYIPNTWSEAGIPHNDLSLLNSLEQQTLGLCHIEFIIVWGGSSTIPSEISEFEKAHENSVLIIQAESSIKNELYNVGLAYASSDYILFLENTLQNADSLRSLRLAILQEDADFAACDIHLPGTEEMEYFILSIDSDESRNELCKTNILGKGVENKLYSRDFLQTNHLTYSLVKEKQDLLYAKRIVCTPKLI